MKKGLKLFKLFALFVTSLSLASCGNNGNSEGKKFVDYVHNGSVKINLDYEGKDFYKDGVGQVTLKTHIDGDTDHFTPLITTTSSETIKVRYYGIDTPESTGRVQMWGRTASNFTKEKIKNANENGTIVVSSAQDFYGVPSHDSTGSRYVGLVWINETQKNAPSDSLILLNLWIVQEGLSWVKNVSDLPQYEETFYAAQRQAEENELCLFSSEKEPGWQDGEYEETSLLDIKMEMEKCIADPTYTNAFDNKKVKITGAVSGYSSGTLYITEFFTKEEGARYDEGEYAGINIFCGMSTPPSKYVKYNTYLSICALGIHSETFGFQLTGIEGHMPIVESLAKDDDVKILLTAEENIEIDTMAHTFDLTANELNIETNNASSKYLYSKINLTTPLTVKSLYVNTDGDEFTIRFNEAKFTLFVTNVNFLKINPNKPSTRYNTEELLVGKRLLIKGVYTWRRTQAGNLNFQLVLVDQGSLLWADFASEVEA